MTVAAELHPRQEARALKGMHGFHILAANWTVPAVGPSPATAPATAPAWHGYGQSRVISRAGDILARAASDLKEEIVYADLPLATDVPPGEVLQPETVREDVARPSRPQAETARP